MDTSIYKEALLKKRGEILSQGGGVKPIQTTMGDVNSRQGDLADQASGNNEVHIQLKLKQTDAKILQAIEDRGATVDEVPEVEVKAPAKSKGALLAFFKDEVSLTQAFVDKWSPRVDQMTNARNRSMLRVVIGETLEARRFFEQMAGGRTDLLGRSADGARTAGVVLPVRWVGDAR